MAQTKINKQRDLVEVDVMNMGKILQREVNSAMVTFENHNADNGFMDCDIADFTRGLLDRGYEPVGICKNVPFKPSYTEHSVAFCYKYNEEPYWCHLPENIWFSLLGDVYERKKANDIVNKIMGY